MDKKSKYKQAVIMGFIMAIPLVIILLLLQRSDSKVVFFILGVSVLLNLMIFSFAIESICNKIKIKKKKDGGYI